MSKLYTYQKALFQLATIPSYRWFWVLFIPIFIPNDKIEAMIRLICFSLIIVISVRHLYYSKAFKNAILPASKRFELGNIYLHGLVIILIVWLFLMLLPLFIMLAISLSLLLVGNMTFLFEAVSSMQQSLATTDTMVAVQSILIFFAIYVIGVSIMLITQDLKKQIFYVTIVSIAAILLMLAMQEMMPLSLCIFLGVWIVPFIAIRRVSR